MKCALKCTSLTLWSKLLLSQCRPSPSYLAKGPVRHSPASPVRTWGRLLPPQGHLWRWGWGSRVGTAGRALLQKRRCSYPRVRSILWGKPNKSVSSMIFWLRDLFDCRLWFDCVVKDGTKRYGYKKKQQVMTKSSYVSIHLFLCAFRNIAWKQRRHAHSKWGSTCPLRFLSQVDFECSFQKKKNSRIIFSIFDTITPAWLNGSVRHIISC